MQQDTSWEASEHWYDTIVGKEGHYYHQHVILPNLLRLLDFSKCNTPALLDLACGQGVLARALPPSVRYQGVDLSSSLIKTAMQQTKRASCTFTVGDICKELPIKEKNFTHATIVLALQNVESPQLAIKQAALHLSPEGVLVIVLNHPCFRIPRQTHWGVDEKQKLQYRRVDRYLSPLKIPIQTHPGKGTTSSTTWTFHHSLSDYARFLFEAGFAIQLLEEWVSDKKSTGKNARMENRAREEFPLFLAIKARKM